MMEQVFATTEKLSEVIGNMQKCLQCRICLRTITDPVKTICGHRFCHTCIQMVLQNKRAQCPLCNTALQRRSISKDDNMVRYIDRLHRLIEAIQLDSGVDIESHLLGPRNTREGCSSITNEYCEFNAREIKPSCSHVDTTQSKKQRRGSQPGGNRKSRGGSKRKHEEKEESSITKYLSNCGLSGIERLVADEPSDCSGRNPSENKVNSWLRTLPEARVDPNKVTQVQTAECNNLDDTLAISVSQECDDNKMGILEKEKDKVEVGQDGARSTSRRSSRSSTRNTDKENEFSDEREGRRSSDAKSKRSFESRKSFDALRERRRSSEARSGRNFDLQRDLDAQVENPMPGTSAMVKSRDSSKDRSQERIGDVHKTSPCDLLPTMKQNWSSVAKFGKEMRSKRKKLKSLNVSIENLWKHLEETGVNVDKEETAKLTTIEDVGNAGNQREKQRRDSHKETQLSKAASDGKKNSEKIEDVVKKRVSPENERDRSMLEDVQAGESSFITLEEGEQVHIRNLNNCQMNDIIGIVEEDGREGVDRGVAENQMSPPISKIPPPGEIKMLHRRKTSSETPVAVHIQDQTNLDNELGARAENDLSSARRAMDPAADESCTTSKLQASTLSSRQRLSLKRRNVDPNLDDSFARGDNSRLASVRRDLNRQIDQEEEAAADVDRKNVKGIIEMEVNRSCAGEKQDMGRDRSFRSGLGGFANRRQENKEATRNSSLVMFKKLGKIYKYRKKRVSFLYLGSTWKKAMLSCPRFGLQNCYNPITILDTQSSDVAPDEPCASEFGNNAVITVNDSPMIEQEEVGNIQNIPAAREAKSTVQAESASSGSNEIATHSTKNPAVVKDALIRSDHQVHQEIDACEDLDVVFVSLSGENNGEEVVCGEQTTPGRSRKSPSNTTPSKSVVRMLSPTEDSQLRFLSLGSPTMDSLGTQKLSYQPEPATDTKDTPKKAVAPESPLPSRTLVNEEHKSDSSSSLNIRKRKRPLGHEFFVATRRRSGEEEGDSDSAHSFSSQTTCIRNNDNEPPRSSQKKSSQSDRYQSSMPPTKDIESISLSSGADIAPNRRKDKKVYKRILPLGSSDTDSPEVVSLNKPANDQESRNVSPTSKRKRAVSSDSEEEDVNVIVSSWYEEAKLGERCKKKGKLEERARDSSNSICEARDNAARFNDNKLAANKLPGLQRRHQQEFAGSSKCSEKSNFAGGWDPESRWKSFRENKELFDEDSPDFGATIDKMKDIRNKAITSQGGRVESLMQDNFDDVIANVDTEALIEEYTEGKAKKPKLAESSGMEVSDRMGTSDRGKSSMAYCANFDMENKEAQPLRVCSDDDDNDRTLTSQRASVADESSIAGKIRERSNKLVESARSKQATRNVSANRSLGNNQMTSPGGFKRPRRDNVASTSNNSVVKDTYDQDSLMNVTQQFLMIQQFEEDLFGKAKNSNKSSLEREQKTPQKMKRNEKRSDSKTDNKDVEHSAEEDDIVENTPDTKTKNMQGVGSQPESSLASPITTIIEKAAFHSNTPLSTTTRSSTNASTTPTCKRKIQPLYQSTPKAETSSASKNVQKLGAKTPARNANVSTYRETQRSPVNPWGSVQDIQNARTNTSRRDLQFVCSGLHPVQIASVAKLALMVNARYLKQFDRDVTHVIVKVNTEDNGADKTLKYLQGIAHKKWIVSFQWVTDSLKAKKLVNEELYEAVDSRTLEAGPRKSRLSERNLFEGFAFLCMGPYVDVSVEQYQDLLRATGAIVVDSLDDLTAQKRFLKIIVIQADVYEYEIIEWYRKADAIPIVHDWVVECISQYRLVSMYPYIQELSRQDVLSLGFPEYLVEEEEPDEGSYSTCDVST